MPALTRKRVNDRPATWHVHYAGVRVGVIVERSASQTPRSLGNGIAAFIRAASRASNDMAPAPVSRPRGRRSKRPGTIICPTFTTPIFMHGGTKKLGALSKRDSL